MNHLLNALTSVLPFFKALFYFALLNVSVDFRYRRGAFRGAGGEPPR